MKGLRFLADLIVLSVHIDCDVTCIVPLRYVVGSPGRPGRITPTITACRFFAGPATAVVDVGEVPRNQDGVSDTFVWFELAGKHDGTAVTALDGIGSVTFVGCKRSVLKFAPEDGDGIKPSAPKPHAFDFGFMANDAQRSAAEGLGSSGLGVVKEDAFAGENGVAC